MYGCCLSLPRELMIHVLPTSVCVVVLDCAWFIGSALAPLAQRYSGKLHAGHPVVKWFWEVVDSMSQVHKARLLQFATGTATVPVIGFAGAENICRRLSRAAACRSQCPDVCRAAAAAATAVPVCLSVPAHSPIALSPGGCLCILVSTVCACRFGLQQGNDFQIHPERRGTYAVTLPHSPHVRSETMTGKLCCRAFICSEAFCVAHPLPAASILTVCPSRSTTVQGVSTVLTFQHTPTRQNSRCTSFQRLKRPSLALDCNRAIETRDTGAKRDESERGI